MRSLIAIVLLVVCPAFAIAQGGGGGAGGGGGGAAGGGAAGGTAGGGATGGAAAPAPTTPGVTSPTAPPGVGPSTPSQRVAPQQPGSPNTGTATDISRDTQNPPPSGGGGTARQPGGANSSVQSRENRTGKNPLNETYTSCVRMWDAQTHMTRAEWQRACKRVENRLHSLTTK
jgi:hypothetical protein